MSAARFDPRHYLPFRIRERNSLNAYKLLFLYDSTVVASERRRRSWSLRCTDWVYRRRSPGRACGSQLRPNQREFAMLFFHYVPAKKELCRKTANGRQNGSNTCLNSLYTFNALLEKNLVEDRGWVEYSLYPLYRINAAHAAWLTNP